MRVRIVRFVLGSVLTAGLLVGEEASAHGPGAGDFLLVSLVPGGVGGGAVHVEDEWLFRGLITWPFQVPLGDMSAGEFEPRLRFVLEPIAAVDVKKVQFQLRMAPRVVFLTVDDIGAFASAGTTVQFSPVAPSIHGELGLTLHDGLPLWGAFRWDSWLAIAPEHQGALLVGWSFY